MARLQTLFSRYRLVFVVVAYVFLASITLWNLLAHLNTAVPGGKDSDYYQFLWGYWWMGHALAQGQSPLWTDYVLYPHVSNLSVHTLAPIWYPVYALVRPLTSGPGAGNVMVLLGYVFTGVAMYAWLRRQLANRPAADILAFLGGVAFAFSPYMMSRAAFTHLNLTPLWWFPLILLLWDEIVFPGRWPSWLAALGLALALWGIWLSDLQYGIWLPFAVVGYVLWTLWANRRNRRWLGLILWGGVAVALMAVLAWIYPLAALRQINLDPNEFPAAGLFTLHAYSLPLSALIGLAPSEDTKTLGHVLVWLVWGSIGVALLARLRRKTSAVAANSPVSRPYPGKWFWLILALVPLVMALGPDITIGDTVIQLPYLLLHNALHGQYRVPSRFTAPAAFLLITFLVLAWQPVLAAVWSRRRLLVVALLLGVGVAILADVGAFQPFPVRVLPDYPVHHEIAQEGGDFVVLDVPVGTHYGWTGIGAGALSMYYGSIHEHRMVNGTLSRIPYSTLAYYINSPLFSWFAGERELSAAEMEQAAAEFEGYRRDWPVGYVIAYREWMTPQQQNQWIGWVNERPGLCPAVVAPSGDLVSWRSEALGCPDTVLPDTLEMGTAADWAYIGRGWYDPEVIGGPVGRWAAEEATLRLPLQPDTAYELTFTALGFDQNRTVTLSGSGDFSQTIDLSSEDWREYRVLLPAGALADARLHLRHNGANSAQALGLSADARALAAAYSRFLLRPVE